MMPSARSHTFKIVFLLYALLILGYTTVAAGNEQLLRQGDAAYQSKAYDNAISYYEQAARTTPSDALAFFKLGNAHYRLRHIGEAVLAYERALKLRPGFAAAAHNVRVIQQQVQPNQGNEIFFVSWWRNIASPILSDTWAVLAVITFASIMGLLAWSHYKRKKLAWLKPQVIVGGLLLSALFAGLGFAGAWSDVPRSKGVVMRPDSEFKPVSSGAKGGLTLSLPEGLLVKVLHAEKDRITIELANGQEGFVQRSDIATVE